jgi:hypothetical protein
MIISQVFKNLSNNNMIFSWGIIFKSNTSKFIGQIFLIEKMNH